MNTRVCPSSLLFYGLRKTALFAGRSDAWERFANALAADAEALRRIDRRGRKLFQIVGVPRSGTTLLGALADSHSKAVCLIEPYWAWKTKGYFDYTGLPELGRGGAGYSMRRPAAFLERLARRTGADWIGFKECFRSEEERLPSEAFHKDLHARGIVDATLGIVRDPRDVWLSVIRRPHQGDKPLTDTFTNAWNRFGRWLLEEDLPALRYEDLAADPGQGCRTACERLGLPFEEAMLAPAPKTGAGDERAQEGGGVFRSSVGRYRAELPAEACRFIEERCGEIMDRFGYGRDA